MHSLCLTVTVTLTGDMENLRRKHQCDFAAFLESFCWHRLWGRDTCALLVLLSVDSHILCCYMFLLLLELFMKNCTVAWEQYFICEVALQWTLPSARDISVFYKVWVRKNLLNLFQLWLPSYLGISDIQVSAVCALTQTDCSHNRHFVLSLGAAMFLKRSYSLSQRWWFPSTSPRSPIVCLSCLIFHPHLHSSTSEQAVCSPTSTPRPHLHRLEMRRGFSWGRAC